MAVQCLLVVLLLISRSDAAFSASLGRLARLGFIVNPVILSLELAG
jgi:hypothetical protein